MNMDKDNEPTRSSAVLSEGTVVSSYRILKKIGAGGMGEVYLAVDTRLNRQVAMKFLPSHLVVNDDVRSRFLREAQAVAKLNHPNVVTIHDVNEFNGRPYFVMEHIEGKSLHHYAHHEQLPIDTIIEYAIQICQGLGEAHRAGIIHRDIKTTNIAIDDKDRIRILDFGLAISAGDDKLTKTGSTLGTVSYMSPEQVSGREIDQRSDLFSLGIVLYELIAHRTPFKRDNEGATLKAIMEDNPEPLTRYKSDVPEKLQEIIFQLLDKDKELRYPSAEGVMADLKRLTYDSRTTQQSSVVKKEKSKIGIISGIIGGLVIIMAIVTLLILKNDKDKEVATNDMPMIAVLPFDNLGSADDEYFADGMTDEITSRLASIKGLGVISRTSSMQYKNSDKSLREIGAELGVDYILEGTVRWSKSTGGTRVRITPQLVRVSDDLHLWADNYERALLEIFEVQEDIAVKIVEQLDLTLLEKDRRKLSLRPTDNERAYEHYLKALNASRRYEFEITGSSNVFLAKPDVDSAVLRDPNFAEAHALRSVIYSTMYFVTNLPEFDSIAQFSVQKALELKPGLPAGYRASGVYHNFVKRDYERALEEFRMAKSELHNDAKLLDDIALVLMRQGKFEESQQIYSEAIDLDPLSSSRHQFLGTCLSFTHSWEEAKWSFDRAIGLEPNNAINYAQRMDFAIDVYGDWESIEPIVRKALENSDTLEFFTRELWLLSWMPELPALRILDGIRKIKTNYLAYDEINLKIAQGYFLVGDSAMAQLYLDSSKYILERELEKNSDQPHRTADLGLTTAFLGDCEKGIELGLLGKEQLSVADCHW